MKYLFLITLFVTTSCSSSKFDKRVSDSERATEHLSKDDKVIGGYPSWVDSEGVDGAFVYAVGEAEDSISQNIQVVKELAAHNAKMRIVERLPARYQYIVQNSLSSASNSEFNKVEIVRGDLQGLQGVKTSRKHTACRKVTRQTEFGVKVNRICFVQASVSLKNLNDAVSRTISMRFGEETGNKFSKVLEKQVERELLTQ